MGREQKTYFKLQERLRKTTKWLLFCTLNDAELVADNKKQFSVHYFNKFLRRTSTAGAVNVKLLILCYPHVLKVTRTNFHSIFNVRVPNKMLEE